MNTKLLINEASPASSVGGLFNSHDFFRLHKTHQSSVFFEWEQDGKVVASIHFTEVDPGHWRSPARGTYAGFAWVMGLGLESLFSFNEAVHRRLKELGATQIEVLLAPVAHDPTAFSTQVYILHAYGYENTQCDLNYSLLVDERPLNSRMSYGNIKRFRKCIREGLVAQLLQHNELNDVYETIKANRLSKGHEMSMSLLQLNAMVDFFPEKVFLFGCRMGGNLIAAAVCLQVEKSVLYVFYWGDRPGYSSYSPVVTLADAIYAHCLTQGTKILDVGTSTVDRQPNFGLIQFKSGLGFTESLKVRMSFHI